MPRTNKLPVQSQDSDDAGMMELVAQKMQTSWEKKRKDQEQKFLQGAKTELAVCGNGHAEEFASAIKQMDSIYEQFLMDYATICDDIRRILTGIAEEQKKFMTVMTRQQKSVIESDKEREASQINGLAMAKKAIADHLDLIEALSPST
ncbi:hypothetical protein EIP91_010550 [Steccherinum ochraceum]|uniref:Uncharacterized protein n=1 Tax=Steccherinum ochraceum TaxID=92696 RepID=A0A4R0R0G7_9APHY|nr:hypothetical protein EIP91_010550 [Steccherinum ochraceum]